MLRTLGRWPGIALAIGLAVGVVASADRARAADPALTTREQLVRKWDLNQDGTIDAGEMELARSKMRRERVDLQLGAGIDPLTGQPRDAADEEPSQADEPADALLPEPDQPRRKAREGDADLPGTRVPQMRPPIPQVQPSAAGTGQRASGSVPAATETGDGGSRAVGGAAAPPQRGAGGGVTFRGLTAGEHRGAVTGGARAGAPARPRFLSQAPKPDLNAGRLPTGLPGRGRAPASGGLLPSPRSTRPTLPPPPSLAPSRRTIDDYDVY